MRLASHDLCGPLLTILLPTAALADIARVIPPADSAPVHFSALAEAANPSLDPMLGHPAAIAAAAALDSGEHIQALRLARSALRSSLEPEERSAVLYLEARALAQLARYQEAQSRFEDLFRELAPPALRPHVAWQYVELASRGFGGTSFDPSSESVAEALKLVSLDSRRGPDAALHLARVHLARGELEAAERLSREAARRLEGQSGEASALLLVARCLEARAREAFSHDARDEAALFFSQAAAAYQVVATQWPDQPPGSSAQESSSRLSARNVRPAPVDVENELARARRIAASRGPRSSSAALHRLRRLLPQEARHEIDLLLARAAEERRQFNSARRLYSLVHRNAKEHETRAQAALGIERVRARRAPSLAIERHLEVADSFAGTHAATVAVATAGEIAWRLGRIEEAASIFERCLDQSSTRDIEQRCRLGLSFILFRQAEPHVAIRVLEPVALFDTRTRYWYGRFLEESGSVEAARAVFTALFAEQSLSYYPMLAWVRMGGTLAPWESSSTPTVERAANQDVAAAEALLRMGLATEARALLLGLDRQRLKPADRRLASRLLMALGDVPRAIRMAPLDWDDGLPLHPNPSSRMDAALAFPTAFSCVIESKSRDRMVPSALLYALIRAESAFDPHARSHARALGLTQVIQRTAATTARRLEISPFRFSMLTQPEVSVRVGSSYLGWLLQRYDGNVALAVAAYNAGEDAVDRWLGVRGHLPIDAFIEEIPFQETNRYTRRVLTFLAAYWVLSVGPDRPPIDNEFMLAKLYGHLHEGAAELSSP